MAVDKLPFQGLVHGRIKPCQGVDEFCELVQLDPVPRLRKHCAVANQFAEPVRGGLGMLGAHAGRVRSRIDGTRLSASSRTVGARPHDGCGTGSTHCQCCRKCAVDGLRWS